MMLGGYLGFTALMTLSMALVPALAVVMVAGAVVGIVVHVVVIRPLLGRPLLTLVMATFALSLIIEAAVSMSYGATDRAIDSGLPEKPIVLGGVRLSTLDVAVTGISVLCMVAFGLFFRYSRLGLHMRATAEHGEAASLSGVNVDRIFVGTFAMAVALAALGGVLLAQLQLVSLSLSAIGLLAFPAAVIGGLRSIPGAVVGGVLVGVLQSLGGAYIASDAKDVVVYAVLLLVLLVRPSGLFGEREIIRL
jgi:branched-chain amino acid transport system permease protein